VAIPGYLLLDDGYIEYNFATDYNKCLRKSEFFRQISATGFTLIHEEIFEQDGLKQMKQC